MTGVDDLPILTTHELKVGVPGRQIVHGVDLELARGRIVLLVGHNGAGKTTLLEGLMGLCQLQGGRIVFEGKDLGRADPATRVATGLAVTRQSDAVFRNLSVGENLRLAGAGKQSSGEGIVFDVFPILRERQNQLAGTLSGGQRQMLSIGLALQCNPKVLLLDEPSVGLQPTLVKEVLAKIDEIRNELGLAVLLVEQNIGPAIRLSDEVLVMSQGLITYRAAASEVVEDEVWAQL